MTIRPLKQPPQREFKALAKNASKEDIIKLLSLADGSDPRMVDYVRAILSVSIVVNEETVEETAGH